MWIEGDDAHDNDDGGRGGNDGNRHADFLVDSMRRSSPTVHECFLGVLLNEKEKHSVRLYDESGEFVFG